ncbi:MAG: cytochrome c [Bryobacterales bacterium]
MRKLAICLFALACCAALSAQGPEYGLGHAPSEQDLKAIDISVGPDGANLPPGEGTVADGAQLYERTCRECHGPEGKGSEETGFIGTPQDLRLEKPKKTVGSYWPYATTLYDYIRRAMPFKTPGSLSDDQVYAVTAYILSLNGLVPQDGSLNAEKLKQIEMPNKDGFVPDPRPDVK